LHRSTRKITFTPEGQIFLAYARQVLALAEAAEADVSHKNGKVEGRLRVNCGTAFARHKLAPLLPRFLSQYPNVTVDVSVSDYRINPIEKQIDVTIRVGLLENSDLLAARLGTVQRIIAASPAYLARCGTPKTIEDLKRHDCLLLTGFAGQALWPMIENGKIVNTAVTGTVASDSADTLLRMAIEGVGIIRLGDFLGERAIADGRLVELFNGQHDTDPKPISALMLPGRQNIPRIRAFVDFLKDNYMVT
jgi:DNA-binding transcriptional LysR family regulator